MMEGKMATDYWNGGTGNWADPTQWQAGVVPQPGDTAKIDAGTCEVTDRSIGNVNVLLAGPFVFAPEPPTLDLHNAVLGNMIVESGTSAPVINVSGAVLMTGTVQAPDAYTQLDIALAPHSLLVNTGTISGAATPPSPYGASVEINGDASDVLVNSGTIAGGYVGIGGLALLGDGKVTIAGDGASNCSVSGLCGPRQTFLFEPPPPNVEVDHALYLEGDASEFFSTIAGFAHGDGISLGQPVTSDTFNPATGVLTVFDGAKQVAALHFAGSYTQSDFVLSNFKGVHGFIGHT
jgi:hypothetical protein